MRIFIILIAAAMATAVAQEAPEEIWQCQASLFWEQNGTILVVAIVDKGRRSGSIKVAGVTHSAIFKVEGFDRRWDFGGYEYAFVVEPDGTGLYYDFTRVGPGESVKPRQRYVCRQSYLGGV